MHACGTDRTLAVAALVYFGLAHRVLDRMRLTDRQALLLIGLMLLGSFVDIPLLRNTVDLSINVGVLSSLAWRFFSWCGLMSRGEGAGPTCRPGDRRLCLGT